MSDIPDLDVFQCDLDGINLIEASAGTGKTWNICGLYLRLLLERGLDVQAVQHSRGHVGIVGRGRRLRSAGVGHA